MHTLTDGYRGLRLLVSVNGDRLFHAAMLILALFVGAYAGTFF